MIIYLKLFFTFFKIGLFSFGGGYSMLALIQKEIEIHAWITHSEFIDIIAISEMTPGPISINVATFVGFKTASYLGSIFATFGIALPSLIIILFISKLIFKYQKNHLFIMNLYGIKAVITALILYAGVFVTKSTLFKIDFHKVKFNSIFSNFNSYFDPMSLIFFGFSLFFLIKYKINPILLILISGILSIIIKSLNFF